MENIYSYNFFHNGKTYVIKVFQNVNTFKVESYFNNMVVDSYEYSDDYCNKPSWKYHFGDIHPHVLLKEFAELRIMQGFGAQKGY